MRLLNHVLPFLGGYIWQRDRFSLHLSAQQQAPWHRKRMTAMHRGQHSRAESAAAAPQPPHLWGSVDFGDNVEDEWFIVWLLLELTQAFPVTARFGRPRNGSTCMPGVAATSLLPMVNGSAASLRPCSEGCCLPKGPACSPKLRPGRLRLRLLLTVCYCPPTHLPACRVWDNDGEFLLIEAAYGLPRWVKPETAQNRVWLHGGAFHLVPLPRFAGQHSGGGRCRGPALHVPAGMLALECQ